MLIRKQFRSLYSNLKFAFSQQQYNIKSQHIIEMIQIKNLQIGLNWLFFSTLVIQLIFFFHVMNDISNVSSEVNSFKTVHFSVLICALLVFVLYKIKCTGNEYYIQYVLIAFYIIIWALTAYGIELIWHANDSARQLLFLAGISLAIGAYSRLILLFISLLIIFFLYAHFTIVINENWPIRYSISLIKFPVLIFACVFTLRWWLAFGINEYVNNINLTKNLEDQLTIDELTQVTNRRGFNQNFLYAVNTTQRFTLPLSLIILDIDYFKKFNDSLGHQAGDQCLINVAQCINSLVNRSTDTFARIGGEEFGLILPGCTSKQAANFAKLIKESLEVFAIEHPNSEVSELVTVSIGIAEYDQEETQESFFERADQALYRAKSIGRNTWSIS